MELVCPAGTLPGLKAAVDAGADAVYLGLADATNARRFAGLNFNPQRLREGLAYARAHGTRVFLAVNTYPLADSWSHWQEAVDLAAELALDALIAADVGVLDYAARCHPTLPRHLSVQGSATNRDALRYYVEAVGIARAVLPRVLSLTQVKRLAEHQIVDLEVFAFGSLCVMVEGRCSLSAYATGEAPNTQGVCSPASAVRWDDTPAGLEARLGGFLIDRYEADEPAGYPTLCKGRFVVEDTLDYAIEEPVSLNTLPLLPALADSGIKALKIEGRQRSPAYVASVAAVWRAALDTLKAVGPAGFRSDPQWLDALSAVSEGRQTTLGAYHRPWM